jgi:hypothetical protein
VTKKTRRSSFLIGDKKNEKKVTLTCDKTNKKKVISDWWQKKTRRRSL